MRLLVRRKIIRYLVAPRVSAGNDDPGRRGKPDTGRAVVRNKGLPNRGAHLCYNAFVSVANRAGT